VTLAAAAYRWQDGERLIVFGERAEDAAAELLPEGEYTLLTTERASADAPSITARARSSHFVGAGRVDELAAALRPAIRGELIVALGGGRVIDVAKALAAADPPRRAAAIPTTLSGAEMTAVHRHAAGVAFETTRVRPALVINDPELCASQPTPALAASAANALAHAAEGVCTTLAHPVAVLAAGEAAGLLAEGLAPVLADDAAEPERRALAAGALLAGFTIGSTWYGLHHVLAQTLARLTSAGHGGSNAIMLPHTIAALSGRCPKAIWRIGEALGCDPSEFAAQVCAVTGASRLSHVGVTEAQLDVVASEAAGRPELALTPPAAERDELRTLLAAAF
jgi:alcohol dehydrogenase class IV